jgi:hypothetical protein
MTLTIGDQFMPAGNGSEHVRGPEASQVALHRAVSAAGSLADAGFGR